MTNRALPGDRGIWRLRERSGKSEGVHSPVKSDLAGGQMPSMKRLALDREWEPKRMEACATI